MTRYLASRDFFEIEKRIWCRSTRRMMKNPDLKQITAVFPNASRICILLSLCFLKRVFERARVTKVPFISILRWKKSFSPSPLCRSAVHFQVYILGFTSSELIHLFLAQGGHNGN